MKQMKQMKQMLKTKPFGQSQANFDSKAFAIAACINEFKTDTPWIRIEPTRWHPPLSVETFAARFRDAVRWGVYYRYSSKHFLYSELCEVNDRMKVSMVDPPFVWIYDKKERKRLPFEQQREQQRQQQRQLLMQQAGLASLTSLTSPASPDQLPAQAAYTFTATNITMLHTYLSIHSCFDPPLIVKLVISIERVALEEVENELKKLEQDFGCTIDPIEGAAGEYIVT